MVTFTFKVETGNLRPKTVQILTSALNAELQSSHFYGAKLHLIASGRAAISCHEKHKPDIEKLVKTWFRRGRMTAQ